jgi:trehalose-phosphatase
VGVSPQVTQEHTPPPAVSAVDAVLAVIAARVGYGPLLLLSDFDGTLCEFRSDPDDVWLPPSRRAVLGELAGLRDVVVGLVSGRRIEDVRRRAGIDGTLYYAGLHGLEIRGDGTSFLHGQMTQTRGLLRVIARSLRAHVTVLPGVFVEDKDLSVALHVREASAADRQAAEVLLQRVAGPHLHSGLLKMLPGDCVFEMLPDIAWTKGDAVRWICRAVRESGGRQPWPVYFGDDLTDEDAFAAVGTGGVSVKVGGRRPTAAAFRIDGPPALEELLWRLAGEIRSRQ